MPKRATTIHLSERDQAALTQLTRRYRSEQQVVLRARIILRAAQGASNAQIARELGINVDTVRLWKDRWASQQEAENAQMDQGAVRLVQRLQDALALERFPHLPWNNGLRWLLWLARPLQKRAVRSASGRAERSPTN